MSLRVASAGTPVLLTGVFSALIALSGCGNEQSDLPDYGHPTGTSASHGSLPGSAAATTHTAPPSLPATTPQVPPTAPPAPPSSTTNTPISPSTKPQQPSQHSSVPPSPPPVPVPSPSKRPPSPPPPQALPLPASHYEWRKDSFEHSGEFSNRCVYPTADREYPGTMLDELFAWRDLVNKFYLYRDELIDLDPRNYLRYGKDVDDHFDIMTNQNSYIRKMIASIVVPPVDWAMERVPTGGMRDELFKVYRTSKTTGFSYGFAIDFEVISDKVPRNYIVRYVDNDKLEPRPSNPSDIVKRGDKLLEVGGLDFVNSQDKLEIETMMTTLQGRETDDAVTFVFSDRDNGLKKTVKLEPFHWYTTFTEPIKDKVIETDTGKVGYLRIDKWGTTAARYQDSVSSLKESGITDLVVDFRYYSRGSTRPDILRDDAALVFMIAGRDKIDFNYLFFPGDVYSQAGHFRRMTEDEIREAKTNSDLTDKQIEEHRLYNIRQYTSLSYQCPVSYIYKSSLAGERFKKGWNCSPFHGDWIEVNAFVAFDDLAIFSTLNLDRVFILVSEYSCRQAELFINALKGVDVNVILIGRKTCGNPYLISTIENCGVRAEIISQHFVNEELFWDYGDGFKPSNSKTKEGVSLPGCYVEDDFTKDLGDKEEAMLSAALQYRKNKTCPPVP